MRLFTAIDVPDEVSEALHSFVRRLMPFAKLSWSRVDHLHITTKFIGEWPEARLAELQGALEAACEPQAEAAMAITVKGIGWFPDARRPRVFWAGVNGGVALAGLARRTEQATSSLGLPAETRAFSPHLTLARIRTAVALEPLQAALDSLPSGCGFDFGAFEASRFFLYLSAGGQYTKLSSYQFADGQAG